MTTETITAGYQPRAWQQDVHQHMAQHRYTVIVAHRRSGKTVAAVNTLIAAAMANSGGRFAFAAPTIKQARGISWQLFKECTAAIPHMTFRESELRVIFPNGSEIGLYSGELHDAMRGIGLDGVVLDEIANFPAEAWGSSIRPTLSDRNGFALLIGTPRGVGDQFHQMYLRGQNSDYTEWWSGSYPADVTGVISDAELKSAKQAATTEAQFEREFLCSFEASTDETLIPISTVRAAMARYKNAHAKDSLQGSARVIGVDVARFGADKTVFSARWGVQALPLKVYEHNDLMHTVGLLSQFCEQWKPDAVFIDEGGLGGGLVDRMQQLGYDVVGVNFGAKALDPRYFNRRAEMYVTLKEWLEDGGILPEDQTLLSDLTAAQYSFDASNRLKLERKEEIKKRLGKSPDLSDALALTFAYPVQSKSLVQSIPAHLRPDHMKPQIDYDPFAERN